MRMTGPTTMLSAGLAVLLVAPSAATADPAASGHTGANGQGGSHFSAAGPDAPGIAWMTDLGFDLASRVYEDTLQIDDAGRIVVQGRIEDKGGALNARHMMQAVDAATGDILWDDPLLDISAKCGAVATDDGRIIAQLDPSSDTQPTPDSPLVAIDAATGTLVADQRFTSDSPRLRDCTSRLLLTGDLVLIPVGGANPGIRAIDISTTPWTEAWTYLATTVNGDSAGSGRNDQIVLDASGETAYHVALADADADPLMHRVTAVRTADGTVRDRADLPGVSSQSQHGRFIAVDGGVVVSVDRCDGAGAGATNRCVAMISDDGTSLTKRWVVQPVDPQGKRAPFSSLTDTGVGIVAGWISGTDDIYGLDLKNGEVVLRRNPSSFSNNGRQLISDGDGTLINGAFGGDYLQAFDTSGADVFTIGECATSTDTWRFGEPMAVGGIANDGTLVTGNAVSVFANGSKTGETYVVVGLRDGASLPQGSCPVQPATVDRVSGVNRIETAVEVSRASFPTQDSADTVLLAVSSNYPDALAGGPLARKLDAPLLLTGKNSLDSRTRAEIQRLGARNVVLLGGTGALSTAVEQELLAMGLTTDRIAGPNRFDTARRIGERLPSTTVYVTEGGHPDPSRGWADAVSVSGLAAFEQRPILLVTKDRAPQETLRGLREHGATEIVIVGGTGAVSDATARALADYIPGGAPEATITRLAGTSRYATSVAVARRAVAAGASTNDLWFATGLSFPDALTAGPAVARSGGVLLLVHGRQPEGGSEVYDFLASLDREQTQRVWFVGGTGAISNAVANKITNTLGVS